MKDQAKKKNVDVKPKKDSASTQNSDRAATPHTSGSSSSSIADIFRGMKQPSNSTPENISAKNSSSKKRPREERKQHDGLYRAAESSVTMDDSAFFEGVESQRSSGKKKLLRTVEGSARRTTVSAESQGVGRIVTEEEIRKMTSRNKKAGTTPNCPFECDCCY